MSEFREFINDKRPHKQWSKKGLLVFTVLIMIALTLQLIPSTDEFMNKAFWYIMLPLVIMGWVCGWHYHKKDE